MHIYIYIYTYTYTYNYLLIYLFIYVKLYFRFRIFLVLSLFFLFDARLTLPRKIPWIWYVSQRPTSLSHSNRYWQWWRWRNSCRQWSRRPFRNQNFSVWDFQKYVRQYMRRPAINLMQLMPPSKEIRKLSSLVGPKHYTLPSRHKSQCDGTVCQASGKVHRSTTKNDDKYIYIYISHVPSDHPGDVFKSDWHHHRTMKKPFEEITPPRYEIYCCINCPFSSTQPQKKKKKKSFYGESPCLCFLGGFLSDVRNDDEGTNFKSVITGGGSSKPFKYILLHCGKPVPSSTVYISNNFLLHSLFRIGKKNIDKDY